MRWSACWLVALLSATGAWPLATTAESLPIFGGPTYSPSSGGYIATDPVGDGRTLWSAHVNDLGMAAATSYQVDGSRTPVAQRAVAWSASTAPQNLVDNPRYAESSARAINADGMVVGYAVTWDDRYVDNFDFTGWQQAPVRWPSTSASPMVLDYPYMVERSYSPAGAVDINDAGTSVGSVHLSYRDEAMVPHYLGNWPARWDASGPELTKLGLLEPNVEGRNSGAAFAINSAGDVIGYSFKYTIGHRFIGSRAVRWDADSTNAVELENLGTLQNPGHVDHGYTESYAWAISDSGIAAGYCNVYNQEGHLSMQHSAARWDASGAVTELGRIGQLSGTVSPLTHAVNDAGTVVGWTGIDAPQNRRSNAIRWDGATAAATELGNIDDATFGYSAAWAVNAHGTAVGWASANWTVNQSDFEQHATYWGADDQAMDLNTLIDPQSGWLLERALDISDTGWIVGIGQFDPDGPDGERPYRRHFLMQVPATVPEPASVTLLSVLISAVALTFISGNSLLRSVVRARGSCH